ncbi:MAG: hypothetical protein IPG91_07245 [Ideonella sp.]|nr:hypothetical protein [Ideonella sp.]
MAALETALQAFNSSAQGRANLATLLALLQSAQAQDPNALDGRLLDADEARQLAKKVIYRQALDGLVEPLSMLRRPLQQAAADFPTQGGQRTSVWAWCVVRTWHDRGLEEPSHPRRVGLLGSDLRLPAERSGALAAPAQDGPRGVGARARQLAPVPRFRVQVAPRKSLYAPRGARL